MDEKRYLEERLEDQIKWYSSKSSKYKCIFYIIRTLEVALAASVPVMFHYVPTKSFVPSVGAIIAMCASLTSLFRLYEKWISYRSTSEILKKEKYLYLTRTSPYDKDDRFHKLVDNVELTVSIENTSWSRRHSSDIGNDRR